MDDLTLTGLTGVGGAAFTVILVWVIRELLAWPDDRWKRVAPALAIVCGIGWNWLAFLALQPDNIQPWLVVLFGVLSGFAASGAWSSGKNALVEPAREARATGKYRSDLKGRIDRFVPKG